MGLSSVEEIKGVLVGRKSLRNVQDAVQTQPGRSGVNSLGLRITGPRANYPVKSPSVSQSDATFPNSTRVPWKFGCTGERRSEKVRGVTWEENLQIVDWLYSAYNT